MFAASPKILDVLEPDPALTEAYLPRFAAFKPLYRLLKPLFSSPGRASGN